MINVIVFVSRRRVRLMLLIIIMIIMGLLIAIGKSTQFIHEPRGPPVDVNVDEYLMRSLDAENQMLPQLPPEIAEYNYENQIPPLALPTSGMDYGDHGLVGASNPSPFGIWSESLLTCPTLKEVEAKIILTGMKLALEPNLEHIVIEDDSKLMIDAIKYRGIKRSWRIFLITIVICQKVSLCHSITWKWFLRSSNRAAHAAVSLANSRVRFMS
ncbi:hypothetical protein DVH24_002616 [Malus domestica]|uniref:RNase H type-1 domain-containing protein n=1 Tax=Malus domestica TaxID=3750 RepID=A0A498K531_MALDO|nr:hypothetical protein DVH24_002616 [Malus domestica]